MRAMMMKRRGWAEEIGSSGGGDGRGFGGRAVGNGGGKGGLAAPVTDLAHATHAFWILLNVNSGLHVPHRIPVAPSLHWISLASHVE